MRRITNMYDDLSTKDLIDILNSEFAISRDCLQAVARRLAFLQKQALEYYDQASRLQYPDNTGQ